MELREIMALYRCDELNSEEAITAIQEWSDARVRKIQEQGQYWHDQYMLQDEEMKKLQAGLEEEL